MAKTLPITQTILVTSNYQEDFSRLLNQALTKLDTSTIIDIKFSTRAIDPYQTFFSALIIYTT